MLHLIAVNESCVGYCQYASVECNICQYLKWNFYRDSNLVSLKRNLYYFSIRLTADHSNRSASAFFATAFYYDRIDVLLQRCTDCGQRVTPRSYAAGSDFKSDLLHIFQNINIQIIILGSSIKYKSHILIAKILNFMY